MEKWLKKTTVYKDLGMTRQLFSHHWNKNTIFENKEVAKCDRNGVWLINVEHPLFVAWSQTHKVAKEKKKDLADLSEKSLIAEAEAKIYEAEIKQYKAETAKIDLQKKRFELIEKELAVFYYLGYIDKLSRDILRAEKKYANYLKDQLEVRLEPKVLHSLIVGFKKLYQNETESTIRSVKLQQKKEVEEWENGE